MQSKRREFLVFSSMVTLTSYLDADTHSRLEKTFKEVKNIIYEVQKHMFPKQNRLPAAENLPVIKFLYETMAHKSFDKDIREFVIEGARELDNRTEGKFSSMSINDKEKALRAYEEIEYGASWLSRIMTLTMEGMFSDPIYDVNIQEQGWKALDTTGGQPRPKMRYLDV